MAVAPVGTPFWSSSSRRTFGTPVSVESKVPLSLASRKTASPMVRVVAPEVGVTPKSTVVFVFPPPVGSPPAVRVMVPLATNPPV